MSDNDKVIDKIRKLLAMAEDTSSPNEAMIAARKARKLMDKHQLSKEDIQESELSQFLETKADSVTRQRKTWMLYLASAVGQLNDCTSVVTSRPEVEYRFQGFTSDAVVAKLTMDYLVQECERQVNLSDAVGASERNFFRLGFATEINTRIMEIKREREKDMVTETGTELIPMKQKMIEQHFGKLKTFSRSHRQPSMQESGAYMKGVNAGRSANLDKQVSGSSQGVLNG